MKRLFSLVLCLMLLFAFSKAEENDPFACDCGFDAEKGEKCACYLQEGDIGPFVNGVIVLLKEKGYLAQAHARGVFDGEVTQAVMRFQYDMDLTETGVLDHETLRMLVFFGLPEALWPDEADRMLVWVPTDGGEKRHILKECSLMIAPRKISNTNAAALGIEMCEHCMKEYMVSEDVYE